MLQRDRALHPDATLLERHGLATALVGDPSYRGRWLVMSTSGFASTMKHPSATGDAFFCRLEPHPSGNRVARCRGQPKATLGAGVIVRGLLTRQHDSSSCARASCSNLAF